MGYEKAASFSMNFNDLTFSGRFASNNVFPIQYEYFKTKEFTCPDKLKHIMSDEDYFIFATLIDVSGGMIQFNKSVSSKYQFAFLMAKLIGVDLIKQSELSEQYDEYGLYSFFSTINRAVEIDDEHFSILKNILNAFKYFLNKADLKIDHKISFGNYNFTVFKFKTHGFSYGPEGRFSSVKELVMNLNKFNYNNLTPIFDHIRLIDKYDLYRNYSTDNGLHAEALVDEFKENFLSILNKNQFNNLLEPVIIYQSLDQFLDAFSINSKGIVMTDEAIQFKSNFNELYHEFKKILNLCVVADYLEFESVFDLSLLNINLDFNYLLANERTLLEEEVEL